MPTKPTQPKQLTKRQAWIKIRDAFEQFTEPYEHKLAWSGICFAIDQLHLIERCISYKARQQMKAQISRRKPKGAYAGNYWWPITKSGAIKRVSIINRILSKSK
jgi:hypothetical protein